MEPGHAAERLQPSGRSGGDPEAIEFVRFCYRRRRVGWPELYDEMCAVAGRGLYRGLGCDDLGGIGIGLTLFEMPALAALVQQVVAEDQARRRLIGPVASPSTEAQRVAVDSQPAALAHAVPVEPRTPADAPDQAPPRLVVVAAGA